MNNDFEQIGKQMPYEIPDGFFDRITSETIELAKSDRNKTGRPLTFAIALSVALVAIVLLFTIPKSDPTDYQNISDCESIDEVMEQMTMEDLQMWAAMNYYPTTEQNNQ